MSNKHSRQELMQWQGLPLSVKVAMTKERIRNWIDYWGEDGVYVSFSGGKDSTVLLHLVREDYPDIPAVFCDTGLEYPEIREFVKTFDNVTWLKPKMNFRQVIERWGYPFISKEVAECVSGARKYLTRVLEEENAPTDRQTDRQNRRIGTSTRNLSGKESTRKKIPYQFEWNKLTGQGKYRGRRIPLVESTSQMQNLSKISQGGVRQKVQKTSRSCRI